MLILGLAIIFNLGTTITIVNSLVVNGYNPITLFFCTLQGMTTLLAFGLMFREILRREEFRSDVWGLLDTVKK